MRPTAVLVAVLWPLAVPAAPPGAPPPPEVLASRDLGPLETNAAVTGRDGAYSTRVGPYSVWVYGDTVLNAPGADGGTWRNNTLSSTRDLWAADGVTRFADWADSTGRPITFLPLTPEEIAWNELHGPDPCPEAPCGYKYGLWPGALLFDTEGGRVLYTYAKMLLGNGAWNFSTVGSGIAVGSTLPGHAVTRPEVAPGREEPTLLFGQPGPVFVNAGFREVVDGVPMLYLVDCSGGDGWSKPMHLARVPAAQALDRSAWRFWSADGTWSPDTTNLAVIFDGADQLSVHWNAHLGKYLAVYLLPLSQTMVGRVAERPEGPWSDPATLFTALAPGNDGLTYCGMTHQELERDGGRYEYVSYVRDLAPFSAERRVVEVEFALRPEADDRDAVYDPQNGVSLWDPGNWQMDCAGNSQGTWRQAAFQFPLHLAGDLTVTEASVRFTGTGQDAGAFTPVLRAVAQDDMAPFVPGSLSPFTEAYPLTSAAVAWTPPVAGPSVPLDTPDLSALVREVLARPGWAAGHRFGLVIPETRKGSNVRCWWDRAAGIATSASLRVGSYPRGAPACLDSTLGDDELRVRRAGPEGCGAPGSGIARECVWGRIGALRAEAGTVHLGPVRCADAESPSGAQVVGARDPGQPALDGTFYLCRPAGAPDFGRGALPDGSAPARTADPSSCP